MPTKPVAGARTGDRRNRNKLLAAGHLPLLDNLYLVRNALFVSAPARIHPIGNPVQYGLDAPDLTLFHLEQLGDLPGPGLGRPGDNIATVRRLVVTGLSGGMIEETECSFIRISIFLHKWDSHSSAIVWLRP